MPDPTIYFTKEEFTDRQARVRAALSEKGLDGMLLFKIEDMYWLCGLDTQGFVIFHAMYIGVNGELTHITRSADVPSIEYSSVCDDVHLWVDSVENSPFNAVREVLERFNLKGKRIGVQHDTFGLTSKMGRDLAIAVGDYCELVDASDIIRLMRVVKSPQELEYIRKAGKIIDQAMAKGIELTKAGAYEGDILSEMHSVIWRSGGDPPASHWPVGSGDKARLVRYATGRGTVGENDQVHLRNRLWLPPLPCCQHGRRDHRPEGRRPPPLHARGLLGRPDLRAVNPEARQHRRGCLSSPRRCIDHAWIRPCPLQCLWLHHGCNLGALLDGAAHDSRR